MGTVEVNKVDKIIDDLNKLGWEEYFDKYQRDKLARARKEFGDSVSFKNLVGENIKRLLTKTREVDIEKLIDLIMNVYLLGHHVRIADEEKEVEEFGEAVKRKQQNIRDVQLEEGDGRITLDRCDGT